MNKVVFCFLALMVVISAHGAHAVSIIRDIDREKGESWVVLPYAFKTESLGLAYGIAGGTAGYGQPQMTTFGAVMATSNDSYGLFLAATKVQVPAFERLFLNAYGSAGWYTQFREYLQGNPDYPYERAGSNDSSAENFQTGEGWNNFLQLEFRFVLPIGQGKDKIINSYKLDRGVLVEGSTFRDTWNPFESGRTYLEIEPFFHWQSFNSRFLTFEEYKTSGIGLGLYYDNTDFIDNPTLGSWQRIKIMRDPGTGANTFAWTALEAEAAKYFSLGENRLWRQQTIGIDCWTAWSPTWKEVLEDGRILTTDRPPDYYGGNLSGFYRMRAFPKGRFHDKAGIYYSLEYRVVPRWQPLPNVKWLRPFEIDWWQLVFFAEAGRVAPVWNVGKLHEKLKTDFGFSLRMMIMRAVGRLDVAFSEESTSVTVLVGHPF